MMKIPELKLKSLAWVALFPALLISSLTWAAKTRGTAQDAAPVLAAASSSGTVDRQVSRPSLPYNDTRLAVFEFDPNLTYEVKTLDSLYTHIEVAPGDKIRGFYPSDTTRWKYHVAGNKERLFIKPSAPGLFNSVTMVTDRRVYELTFVSGKEGEAWYKRVTWRYPDERDASPDASSAAGMDGVFEDIPAARAASARPGAMPSVSDTANEEDAVRIDPSSMRFGYTIEGDAAFRPVTVFDNGKFTWIRFNPNLQDAPAIFAIDSTGQAEIVDYVPQSGGYIMISRVLPGILLKLKSEEVRITSAGSAKKFCVLGC